MFVLISKDVKAYDVKGWPSLVADLSPNFHEKEWYHLLLVESHQNELIPGKINENKKMNVKTHMTKKKKERESEEKNHNNSVKTMNVLFLLFLPPWLHGPFKRPWTCELDRTTIRIWLKICGKTF